MNSYLYCSYAQSRRGFFPAYVEKDRLIPADGTGGVVMPPMIWDFFSYDRFCFLWQEYCDASPYDGSMPGDKIMFGVRGLEGLISGRTGTANIAIEADREEAERIKRIVLAVLGDYEGFASRLFEWLALGGDCGYQLDVGAFRDWLQYVCIPAEWPYTVEKKSAGGSMLKKLTKQKSEIGREKAKIRFAVCTDEWDAVKAYAGSLQAARRRPKTVLMRDEFRRLFENNGGKE